jgi:O-antigen/teichoic acid export membrane protein
MLTAAMSKIISIAASLITVRLTFRYLGAERYGMWVTITSIVMMLNFADLGVNNGLINTIASAYGRDDREAGRSASASAFWSLSGIAAAFLLSLPLAYPFVNGARLFNVHSPLAVHESGPALLVFFACFALNLPMGTVRAVQTGLQRGFINSLWAMLGSLASLFAMLVVIHLHGGLPLLILGLSGPPLLAAILNGVELFGFSRPELLPTPRHFSRTVAVGLFRTGILFCLCQVFWNIGIQTDNIVIAQILGAKMVAAYAVPARLFSIIPSLLSMMSGPLWPAYADAMARSDGPWVRRTFLRIAGSGMAATTMLTIFLVVFGNRILALWVGPQIHASIPLLIVFGILSVLNAFVTPVIFLLNGLAQIKIQVVVFMAMSVVNLTLSIIFVKHFGIIGGALGSVVAEALIVVLPLSIAVRNSLRKMCAS